MATISYTTTSGGALVTNVIFFDATMSENHDGTAEVTEHEVERGADLADHVRPSRQNLSLEVMVSNTPIGSIGRLQGTLIPTVLQAPQTVLSDGGGFRPRRDPQVTPNFVQPGPKLPGVPRYTSPARVVPGDLGQTPVVFTANLFTFLNPRDRLVDLWTALNDLRTSAKELTVVTRLQDYENMLLTRVGAPVTVQDAITFSLTFKQIGYAEALEFSTVEKVKRVAVKKAEPKKDEGPKDPYTIQPNELRSDFIRGIELITGYKRPPTVSTPGL